MQLIDQKYFYFSVALIAGLVSIQSPISLASAALLLICIAFQIRRQKGLSIALLILFFLVGMIRSVQHSSYVQSSVAVQAKGNRFLAYKLKSWQKEDFYLTKIVLLQQEDRSIEQEIIVKSFHKFDEFKGLELVQIELDKIDWKYQNFQWYGFAQHLIFSNSVSLEKSMRTELRCLLLSLRSKVRENLSRYLLELESPLLNEFLQRALLGDSNAGVELYPSFKRLGLAAIFAISGFHVSLLGFFLWFFSSLISLRNSVRFFMFSMGIIAYCVLVGFSVSVLRACVFAILLMSAKVLNRNANPIRILSIALLLHSFTFPSEVFQLGFQLSYGITFALLLSVKFHYSSSAIMMFTQMLSIPYFLVVFKGYPIFSFLSIPLGLCMSVVLGFGFFLLLFSQLPLISVVVAFFCYPAIQLFELGLSLLIQWSQYFQWSLVLTDDSISNLGIGSVLFVAYALLFSIAIKRKDASQTKNLVHWAMDLKKQEELLDDLSRLQPAQEYGHDLHSYSFLTLVFDAYQLIRAGYVRALFYGPCRLYLSRSLRRSNMPFNPVLLRKNLGILKIGGTEKSLMNGLIKKQHSVLQKVRLVFDCLIYTILIRIKSQSAE